MKNSRLFEILYLLVEKRAVTAGELAQRLEVSERTIYRDIEALSAAGIPVFTQQGQGGGGREGQKASDVPCSFHVGSSSWYSPSQHRLWVNKSASSGSSSPSLTPNPRIFRACSTVFAFL